jgi:hypothetical protein
MNEIHEAKKEINLDAPVAARLYAELEQIKNVCKEGNGWCKKDIARAIARLQDCIKS